MEDIFDLLRKEHEERIKNDPNYGKKPKIKIKKATHDPEYIKAYNDTMDQYDDPKYSDGDIAQLIADTLTAPVD